MNARADYIAGLYALASLLETNPEVSLPHTGTSGLPVMVFPDGAEPLAQAIAYMTAMNERPTMRFKDHSERRNFWLEVDGHLRGVPVQMNLRVHEVCEVVDGASVVPPALLKLADLVEPEALEEALTALAEHRRQAVVAPTTVAGILREAARVMRTHAPTVLDVAPTIRLAAGADDAAGRARAEEALEFARTHVEPGVHVADLEHWRRRRTCLQVAEALEMAATAAEQGGDR